MESRDQKKILRLRPSSYQPSKAELEEDMSVDATPEELALAVLQQVEIRKISDDE